MCQSMRRTVLRYITETSHNLILGLIRLCTSGEERVGVGGVDVEGEAEWALLEAPVA